MAWTYLVVTGDSLSPWHHGCDRLPIVNTTPTVSPNFFRAWQKEGCPSPPFGTMYKVCGVGNFPAGPTLSTEDSPARISALREMEQAWTASEAVFLKRSRAWPKKRDHSSYSLRTSLQSEHADYRLLSENWPASGMTRDGVLYPLLKLGLPTEGSDGSCSQAHEFPTPTRQDSKRGHALEMGRTSPPLRTMVLFPTPTVQDSNGRTHHNQRTGPPVPSLLGVATGWRAKGLLPDRPGAIVRAGKATGSQCLPPLTANGGALNPTWVEWLMGVPLGWTELSNLGTEWFQSRRARRSLT